MLCLFDSINFLFQFEMGTGSNLRYYCKWNSINVYIPRDQDIRNEEKQQIKKYGTLTCLTRFNRNE